MLVVLTGKTASGKDTIKSALLSYYPDLKMVITTTSRPPRPGEKDGVQYHFLSVEDFQKAVDEGKFIEYVKYGGNFYGTQKKDILDGIGSNLIWRIDPSRAGEVRDFIRRSFPVKQAEEIIKRVKVIYINTDRQTILTRLRNRELTEDEIEKRMSDDSRIWEKYHNNYDFIVENVSGNLPQTIEKIKEILSIKP